MQQKKESLSNSAMNGKATPRKNDYILIKNHPLYTGQMYQVKGVERNGKVLTTDGKNFFPEYFDLLSDLQIYNGGFGRQNLDTEEWICEIDLKKYFSDRIEADVNGEGWTENLVTCADNDLAAPELDLWLKANKGILVEQHPENETQWRLIESQRIILKKSQFVTLDNAETLQDFEQIIRDNLFGFYLVGKALIEIRDRGLYLDEFNTFEQYCKSPLTLLRLGIGSKGRAYDFINAANVITILEKSPMATQLPTNERQIRPMVRAKLNAEQIIDVWEQAVEEAEEKPPTGAIVEDIVRVLKEQERDKLKLENPYSVGDVLRFNSNGDPETRSRNKRWVIVNYANDYSCIVSDFEGEFNAHLNQLERIEINDWEKARSQILRDRLAAINPSEPLIKKTIDYFAKLERISLSEKEEAILKVLES